MGRWEKVGGRGGGGGIDTIIIRTVIEGFRNLLVFNIAHGLIWK